jgi:(E)-4-hydroxy-3-methylbut-2-enyl-diphosphate synthase
LFESWKFNDIVVSFKSSDPQLTTKLYLEAAKTIKYPLHLGVTESGSRESSIIKTTIGLAPVLEAKIGNTIRVSISGSPLQEPIIAKKLLTNFGLYNKITNIIACPTCGRLQ